MFKWPFFKKTKKPLIIAIHGFGKRRSDEFINLRKALEGYEIITPLLFDQTKEDDIYWFNWVSRAEEAVVEAKNAKRDIVLIGFSMGGVIATYLAAKFEIRELILLAPAFEYMTVTTVQNTVNKALFKKSNLADLRYQPLPTSFTSTFMDVVNNCKDSINRINCPTLIMHCMEDELIPYTVSLKYYKKLPISDKRLILFGEGSHRILDDDKNKDTCLTLIAHELLKLDHKSGKD